MLLGNSLVDGFVLDTRLLLHSRELRSTLIGDTVLSGAISAVPTVFSRRAFCGVTPRSKFVCHIAPSAAIGLAGTPTMMRTHAPDVRLPYNGLRSEQKRS